MSSEIERNSPKNEIFKVENHRSECGKYNLRESRFQNFPGGHAPGPPKKASRFPLAVFFKASFATE